MQLNTARQYRVGLLITVFIAACVRCHNLVNKGLIYWDEGIFISGARFVNWRTTMLFHKAMENMDPLAVQLLEANYRGLPVFLQKPAHVLLLSIWNFHGVNEINSAMFFSVACGLVSIILTSVIAKRWFGIQAGLIAAAWLSVLPYHVYYSRLALHETSSMMLFLLLVYLWRKPEEDPSSLRLLAIGFIAMASMGASYRYLPYLLICALTEFVSSCFSGRATVQHLKRWALLAIGFLACFAVLEGAYYLMFSPGYLWSQPDSYLTILKMKFTGGETSFDLNHLFFYFQMMIRFDGILTLVLLVSSWAYFLYHHQKKNWFLLAITFLPLIMFSLTTTRVPRTITGLLPFFAISVAGFSSVILNRSWKTNKRWNQGFCLIIVILMISSMTYRNRSIWQLKSGYTEVISWLDDRGVETHFTTMHPIFTAYQGRNSVKAVPIKLREIVEQAEERKIRYLTVDWQKFLRYSKGVQEIEKSLLPVHAVEHNPGHFFATLYENHLPEDVPLLRNDPTLGFIKIYDLNNARKTLEMDKEDKGFSNNEI